MTTQEYSKFISDKIQSIFHKRKSLFDSAFQKGHPDYLDEPFNELIAE